MKAWYNQRYNDLIRAEKMHKNQFVQAQVR